VIGCFDNASFRPSALSFSSFAALLALRFFHDPFGMAAIAMLTSSRMIVVVLMEEGGRLRSEEESEEVMRSRLKSLWLKVR
jgi:hypothetical protein